MSIYGLIPDRDDLGSPQEHIARSMEFLNRAHHFDDAEVVNKLVAAVAHLQAGLLARSLQDDAPVDASSQTYHLRIFHNVSSAPGVSYDGSDEVVEVDNYSVISPAITEAQVLLRQALLAFTLGAAYAGDVSPELHQRVADYRRRGNRPLAVGDVIAVDQRYWAVEQAGWQSIGPPVLVHRATRGTTPLHHGSEL